MRRGAAGAAPRCVPLGFARVLCARVRSLSEDADYLLRGARGEVQALLTYAAKAPVCWATQADGAGAAAWDGSVRWDVRVIESFAQQLATTVSTLESRALTLEKKLRQLEANVSELATCEYTADSFAARLKPVQAILDELELGNYSNVAQVAEELAERVADALRRRLEIALRWAAAFPSRRRRRRCFARQEGKHPNCPHSAGRRGLRRRRQRVIRR